MTKTDKQAEDVRIACDVCLKEVPASEAKVSEAADYVAHFCGIECYEQWQKKARAKKDRPDQG